MHTIRLQTVQENEEYWYKEEGHPYTRIRILSRPAPDAQYPNIIGVLIQDIDTGEQNFIGYNPNYPAYEPTLYAKDWD
jgi:hypothetical protein